MFRLFDPGLGPLLAAVIADQASERDLEAAMKRIGPAVDAVVLVSAIERTAARHPVVVAPPETTARLAAALAWGRRVHPRLRGVVLVDPLIESHDWRAIEALKSGRGASASHGPDGLVLWPDGAGVPA